MKKYMTFLALMVGVGSFAFAGWFLSNDYDPIIVSTNNINGAIVHQKQYRIDKPSSGQRNCFTDVALSATGAPNIYTFSILEGPLAAQTTAFMIDITTGPVSFSWPYDNPLCLTPGTTGFFQISGTSASWKLNGRGFIKK